MIITIYGNLCQNWLHSRLVDLCWKIPQEAISRINGPSFTSLVILFASREQYNKETECT